MRPDHFTMKWSIIFPWLLIALSCSSASGSFTDLIGSVGAFFSGSSTDNETATHLEADAKLSNEGKFQVETFNSVWYSSSVH